MPTKPTSERTTFFGQVEARAGLPRVVSHAALSRALDRVGLRPDTVTPENLADALESIASTLRVYHHESEVPGFIDRLRQLCRPPAPTDDPHG